MKPIQSITPVNKYRLYFYINPQIRKLCINLLFDCGMFFLLVVSLNSIIINLTVVKMYSDLNEKKNYRYLIVMRNRKVVPMFYNIIVSKF